MKFLMTENNKKTILYFMILGLFGIAVLLLVKVKIYKEIIPYATYLENTDEEQFIRNLTSGMTIEQEFVSPHDFECVTMTCSNHEKILDGRMVIEIRDGEKELITSKEIENKSIAFGTPVEIHFDGKMGQTYTVKVTALDTAEEAIGFFGYIPEDGTRTAILNGSMSEYALSIGTHVHTKLFFYLLWITLTVLFVGFGLTIWMLSRRSLQPQSVFLMIAVPLGIALLCFMSVNFINDGDAHFARAYLYANRILGVSEQDTMSSIAMRKDDVDTLYSSICQNGRNAQNMCHIYENWSWFVKDETLVNNVEWRSAGKTSIIAYLPSVLAIILARIFKLGTYPMLYLAKIFPLICYLLGGYYAIKITPVGKHIMLFLLSLPMALQQAVGITYDNITYVVLFLMISYTLKIYFEEITVRECIILAILCILLGSCKGGAYAPMLFMLLFLPKSKLGGWKIKAGYVSAVGILTVCVIVAGYGSTIMSYIQVKSDTTVSEFAQNVTQTSDESTENIVSEVETPTEKYGIGYMIKNPHGFLKLVINTVIERTEYYFDGISGRMVAWAVEELPYWSCGLFAMILLLAKNGVGEEKYKIDFKIRVGMMGAFLGVLSVFFILFLIETPTNYSYIWGIQGRYFIPQVMLLLLAFRNNNVIQKSNTENMLYIVYYMQMVLFMIGYFEIFMTQTYNH